jgi:hypothetical protein
VENGNLSIVLTTTESVSPPEEYPELDEFCPAGPLLLTERSPTSVALVLLAKGNLSIVLTTESVGVSTSPPEVYPFVLELCPAGAFLDTVRSPTSVALPSEEKGNLSIVSTSAGVGIRPPEVYPLVLELCPDA